MMICGHRGAAHEAPENTVGGFCHARQQGVRAFELDVRLSRDGQCVVIHDETLDRTTDGQGRVCEQAAVDLARLRAHGPFRDWTGPDGVPTLRAVLACIADAELILVEVKKTDAAKYPIICDELARSIAEFDLKERAVVASFDASLVACARARMPGQPRALIGKDGVEQACEQACDWAMAQFRSVDAEAIAAAHARGVRVACWTPNTEAELAQTFSCKPDVVITDAPSRAMQMLTQLASR